MSAATSIRVLIADDEAMIRAGLRMIMEAEPDIDIVGEAADGGQAVTAAAVLRPDVVLMDVRMPCIDGIAAARRLLAATPQVKVVMLTTFNDYGNVLDALRIGASGFLLKVAPPEQLVEAIRVAAQGNALLDPLITHHIMAALAAPGAGPSPAGPELSTLTARENEVLHLLARGRSNAEIAGDLSLGDATVKTHVARVLMKLHLRDRVQAVIYAYEHGLILPGGEPTPLHA